MKKNTSSYIWGGILILVGLFLAGKAFGFFSGFELFFDGWWSLFIIVPCFIGLFSSSGEKTSYLIGLCLGGFLLLAAQDVIKWRMLFPLCLAVILVIIGVRLIFPKKNKTYSNNYYNSNDYKTYQSSDMNHGDSTAQDNATKQEDASYQNNSSTYSYTYTSGNQSNNSSNTNSGYQSYQGARQPEQCVCTALLSGRELRFDNQVFQGAMLSAVLGGIDLDLRNAIIRENVVIEAKAILGGIDICVPNYARVIVNCNPILGGVDNKTITPMGANEQTITIYLNATCVLGGIDVK